MALDFRRRRPDEPEINLIPFIDVLLVVIIFLMLSTTYARFTELQVSLPVADADRPRELPRSIAVTVTADGRYGIDRRPVDGRGVDRLAAALAAAAGGDATTTVVVSADAAASHQSVVNVMDAARRAGLSRLAFTAQAGAGSAAAEAPPARAAPAARGR